MTKSTTGSRLDAQDDVLRPVVICSWCPDTVERTRAAGQTGALVTHGICPTCLAEMRKDLARTKARIDRGA